MRLLFPALALLALFPSLASGATLAARWDPVTHEAIEAHAAANADTWRRHAHEANVLPGIGPDGRARLMARIRSTDPRLAATRKNLLARAGRLLAEPIPDYIAPAQAIQRTRETLNDGEQELWMRPLGDQLVFLSLVATIEDNPGRDAMRARLRDLTLAACNYPQWGVSRWATNLDLAAAHLARGIAIAWAWHPDLWTETDRALILKTIRRRVTVLASGAQGGIWWSGAYQENHNHVDMAAVGICGAAFLDALPEHAPRWLAAAELNFNQVARHAYADGSNPEGVPYWSYSASFILQYIEGVNGILDTDRFYNMPWLRAMTSWRLHSSTSGLGGTLPWGDAPAQDYYGPHHILRRLASRLRDTDAQYLASNLPFAPRGGLDVLAWDWLWSDPAVPATSPHSLDAHIPDIDIVNTRSGWTPADYLLSLKSGYTNRTHSHLDAGAISFAFGNDWLITTPGYGTAKGIDGFWNADGPRWTFFSNATESHSTLLVNGRNQRFDLQARGTTRTFLTTPRTMWAEVDLSQACHDVTTAWRRILHRRDDYVLILDDLTLVTPDGSVEWLLQVPPSAKPGASGVSVEGAAGSILVSPVGTHSFSPRQPRSPAVDVPDNRLKTYSISNGGKAGGRVEFRTLIAPRFAGEQKTALQARRISGDLVQIMTGAWSDRIRFNAARSADGEPSLWNDDNAKVSATARLLGTRHDKNDTLAGLFAVDVARLKTEFLEFTPVRRAAVVTLDQVGSDLWQLDVQYPATTGKDTPAPEISLSREDWRATPLPVSSTGHYTWLLGRGRPDPDAHARWQAALFPNRNLPDIPVRAPVAADVAAAFSPVPSRTTVRMEAEDFLTETGGHVDKLKKPGASAGLAVRGFGNGTPAHSLAWKIKVPRTGIWQLSLRYCTAEDGVALALLIDGAAPSEAARTIPLPVTGGWSVDTDNWASAVLATIPLTTGEHEIRLCRPTGALNLDLLELHAPQPAASGIIYQ
jgi:hypothetical protein